VSDWVGIYSGGSCAADATVTIAVNIASLPTLLPMIRAHFGAKSMKVMLNVIAVTILSAIDRSPNAKCG
jgi:hypothetical protein